MFPITLYTLKLDFQIYEKYLEVYKLNWKSDKLKAKIRIRFKFAFIWMFKHPWLILSIVYNLNSTYSLCSES